MNDFAKWLEENEVKDTRTLLDPRSSADDEEWAAAFQSKTGEWFQARWDRKNPGNHECFACRGTGIWSPPVYATRGKTGKCFKCQGRGHFKTSAAERTKAREYRRLTTAQKLQSAKDETLEKHGDLIEWLRNNTDWNNFASSLIEQFDRKGTLSEKQIAAAESMRAKCEAKRAEREAAKQAEREQAVADAPEGQIDLSSIPTGYYAVPDGETRLKVRINRPGKQSNWSGWTFVNDGAGYGQGNRYGRQAPGKLYEGKIVEQLKIIAADPEAASKAYGKLVGRCGVCGRLLEDETSVAMGIGPVCAARMGWSR